MSFTRLSDDSVVEPVIVFGPYETGTQTRNIAQQLLESTDTRGTFVPQGKRSGDFQCLFESYAEAYAAWLWFGSASTFSFDGPATTAGEYIIVDGLIVLSAGDPDPSFAMTFIVADGQLRILQNDEMWELYVPFREVDG